MKWEKLKWEGYKDYEALVTEEGYVKNIRKKEVLSSTNLVDNSSN